MEKNTNVFWSSKIAFILAASGSAIGLGNIWRFPYLVAKHGGGTFILTYLLFSFLIGGSVLLAEFVLGRYIQAPILENLKGKLKSNVVSALLQISLLIPFVILTFYFVVCGWTLYYFSNSLVGMIEYHNNTSEYYSTLFTGLLANPTSVVTYSIIFLLLTVYINFRGLIDGIEKANFFLLPLLFVILIVMIVRVLTLDGAMEGVKFYFSFDASNITSDMLIDAMGQACFSLSIGLGIMIVFSSFVKKDYNLRTSAMSTVVLGAGLGLFSAMLIIPVVYAFKFDLNSGPGLTFITLPAIFSNLHFGVAFAAAFFAIMLFAALTSTISLVEAVVPLIEKIFKTTRKPAIVIITAIASVGIIIQALSFNVLSDFTILGKTIFDFTDFSSNLLLILAILFVCIIIGYILNKKDVLNEVSNGGSLPFRLFNIWYIAVKFIIPVVIIILLITYVYSNL